MNTRLGRDRVERTAAELSDRDWLVLADLRRVRLLTTQQIERLHFRDGSPRTQARRCRRTLQRLTDLGVLHRFARRVGGVRAGSAGATFGLATLGQRLTHSAGPAGGVRQRRPWEPSAYFFSHVLAVSELYVQLREADRTGAIDVIGFDAEPACWRRQRGRSGAALVVKPDAYVRVGVGDFEEYRFVEIDRSTESLSVIARKAEIYVDYWRSGDEQRRAGVFPQVLFLVQDEQRAEAVIKALARQPAEYWQLFQVRLASDVVDAICGNDPRAGPKDAAPAITITTTTNGGTYA